MFLTLKEKKQQKIRILVRAIVLSMNTIGLLLCLYIISILTVITKKKEAIDLLNKLLFRGGFLPEEFNTITKVAQMIIFMFMLGLSIVIYSLLVHEIQTRLHIHKLLYTLGYTRLQVFFYEFTYEMWDLFCKYNCVYKIDFMDNRKKRNYRDIRCCSFVSWNLPISLYSCIVYLVWIEYCMLCFENKYKKRKRYF